MAEGEPGVDPSTPSDNPMTKRRGGLGPPFLVHLVSLVFIVYSVNQRNEPNRPDRLNKLKEPER